jgi:hypothetical protein
MDPAPLAFDVKLEPADLVALHRRVARRSKAVPVTIVLVFISFFAAAMITMQFYPHANLTPGIVMLYGALIIYIVLRLAFRDLIYRKAYGRDSYAFDTRRYAFDERGMRITAPYTESAAAWPAISTIEKTSAHIMLLLPGNTQGYVIPFRVLPPGLKPDDVAQQLRDWHARAVAGAKTD